MKKHRKCKKIIAFVTVLFIAFVAVIGLHKTGIYRFDFLKDIYKKIDSTCFGFGIAPLFGCLRQQIGRGV